MASLEQTCQVCGHKGLQVKQWKYPKNPDGTVMSLQELYPESTRDGHYYIECPKCESVYCSTCGLVAIVFCWPTIKYLLRKQLSKIRKFSVGVK